MNVKNESTNFLSKNELLRCDVCMKEVPAAESKLSEVDDYVLYFCGLECYDKWHNQVKKIPKVS